MISDNIDLHTHTTFSDGALEPEELVRKAKTLDLKAIAITDHDITNAIPQALKEGEKQNIEIISGVELSATVKSSINLDIEMHILGYFIRYQDARFQETLALFRKARIRRAEQIIQKLANLGMKLDKDKILEKSNDKAVGRPHIANEMLEAGYISSYNEAFEKYLREGRPAYTPKARLSPAEAIQLIHWTGGLAVVAHPLFGGPKNKRIWEAMVRMGLDGIEVYHSQHSPYINHHYEKIARELNLVITGGSDFHSEKAGPKGSLGEPAIPYSHLEELKKLKTSFAKEEICLLR